MLSRSRVSIASRWRIAASITPRKRFSEMPSKTKKQGGFFGFLKPIHVGGLGAVVLTLATQNLAQELVGGLAIKIQSDVAVGDEVKLGDGTGGIIHHLGWVSSSIRGYVQVLLFMS